MFFLFVFLALSAPSPAQQASESLKSFGKIKSQAEAGNAEAQYDLGRCFYNGDGVSKNATQAALWFRKAADQRHVKAQFNLGVCYANGEGVPRDSTEAARWCRKAAEQGLPVAQCTMGEKSMEGDGLDKDPAQAVSWWRKAAEQGLDAGQFNLGVCFANGNGVPQDSTEAVRWYRKAAEQGSLAAQQNLGVCYFKGEGVTKDYVEAHKWFNLASAQGYLGAKEALAMVERLMPANQVAEAQRLAREFKPRKATEAGSSSSRERIAESSPASSGTGFFITDDGFLATNEHVVKDAAHVRVLTGTGLIVARVVKVDAANDLAVLKVEGKFSPLPIASSRTVKMGSTVATVGFPNIGLQGFSPKLAKGEIASLTGAQDDPRYFQISVPVQPGNSGGALVDERGNVVGVVSAKLSARAALQTSGALPENVNYAVKSSFLLSFLESVPAAAAKLKEPNTKDRKFEDVVKSAEPAAVLVLVY